jgi:hypothetical protein
VAYLLTAIPVELEKQPLIANERFWNNIRF